MAAFLQSHPEVDIVYADYTIIDEEGNVVGRGEFGAPEELVHLINPVGPCFLYRRAVQEKLGGYAEDLFLSEDYDFWLRASVLFRFQPLHKDLYLFRHHSASLTHLHIERIHLAGERALSRNLPQMHWVSDTLRANGYLRLAAAAQARGDVVPAHRHLLRAMRYSPRFVFRQAPPGLLVKVLLGNKSFCLLKSVYMWLRQFPVKHQSSVNHR
jgi:hypothetical protein